MSSIHESDSQHPISSWALSFKVRLKSIKIIIAMLLLALVVWEVKTSILSAMFFHHIAQKFTYTVLDGKQSMAHFPVQGPFDLRLGYNKIPAFAETLSRSHYQIKSQASLSSAHQTYAQAGFFPVYKEKV